ncbi:MAG TPA: DUF4115 domain-containing protein [Anaerolinea thermolimosa]|uniref:DUF4115 domain-containing protein n=1 Tax=Anaerolinea thermolimosa TaxID=229919 RepID=A0A3D1JG87_9CHLR|nr:RodZ domain-containing protein [Anaerolinea thermolimosa]GAP07281.1 hypothetical protein ATHL_02151 [Anaerolinea thermolimosa]HCE17247.1 DUF4115 domain-containing protein [Anaerolinea thermolimosa]
MSQWVGETLKQARIDRGLTLDQAAQMTRIRRNYLEALERGDATALPSAVQAKGFLRLYAGFLGLSAEPLVLRWEGKLPVETAASTASMPMDVTGQSSTVQEVPVDQVPEVIHSPVKAAEEPADAVPSEERASGSEAVFKEIGQMLRQRREALGLSLGEVERYTRMRQQTLRMIESGRMDELPSLVQGRGLLSNYAAFLNLDGEAILLRFAEALQMRRLERMPAEKAGQPTGRGARPASPLRRLLTPDLLIGAGMIGALFLFVVWTALRVSATRNDQLRVTLPSVGEVLLASPTATLDVSGGEGSEGGSETPQTPSPGAQEVVSGGLPTATLAPLNTDPLQIYIVARQRAFLRVVADGVIKFNGRVVPGNAYPFSARETIELVSGNAAAFQIFFNQQDLGPLGAMGAVLRMTFTQNGILTPTPMPTSTPTPTQLNTLTPGVSPTAGTSTVTPTVTPLVP